MKFLQRLKKFSFVFIFFLLTKVTATNLSPEIEFSPKPEKPFKLTRLISFENELKNISQVQ